MVDPSSRAFISAFSLWVSTMIAYHAALAPNPPEGRVPPETVPKQKHGFGMPFQEWLKKDPSRRELPARSWSRPASPRRCAPWRERSADH